MRKKLASVLAVLALVVAIAFLACGDLATAPSLDEFGPQLSSSGSFPVQEICPAEDDDNDDFDDDFDDDDDDGDDDDDDDGDDDDDDDDDNGDGNFITFINFILCPPFNGEITFNQ